MFCPEEDAAFPEVRGLKGPFACLNSARYGIAWSAPGAAEDRFRRPASMCSIASSSAGRSANQLVQKKLADMQTDITLALQGRRRLGRMKDEGSAAVESTSIMKRNSLRQEPGHRPLSTRHDGGNGISDEFGVARHLVNLEVVNTYEGTPTCTR